MLIRLQVRIQPITLMQIHVDPDPQTDGYNFLWDHTKLTCYHLPQLSLNLICIFQLVVKYSGFFLNQNPEEPGGLKTKPTSN
jgi:hypothetical protein